MYFKQHKVSNSNNVSNSNTALRRNYHVTSSKTNSKTNKSDSNKQLNNKQIQNKQIKSKKQHKQHTTPLNITNHALQRFNERVQKAKTSNDMRSWVNKAMNESYIMKDENKNGHTYYRYKQYKLVVSDTNDLITISYHHNAECKDLKQEVMKTIYNRFKKELKPLVEERDNIQISHCEARISYLRAKSKKMEQQYLEEMDTLQSDVKDVNARISLVVDLANKYGIQKPELMEGAKYGVSYKTAIQSKV